MINPPRTITVSLVPLTADDGEELRRKLETKSVIVNMVAPELLPRLSASNEETVFLIIKDKNQALPEIPNLSKPLLLLSDTYDSELKELESIFVPLLGIPKSSSLATVLDALTVLNDMGFPPDEERERRRTDVRSEPSDESFPALGRYLLTLKKRGPLGGAGYAGMFKPEPPLIPPTYVHLDGVITDHLANVGRWQRDHIIRMARVAPLLASPVVEDKILIEELTIAALLMTHAISKDTNNLFRKDYTGRGGVVIRKELASLIKDSALFAASLPGTERITSIIALAARYIGKEQSLEDSPLAIAASALVAADCIDRLVFFTGYFSPEPAHRIIRGVNSGKLKDFHPAVSCNLLKFLAEAIACRKTTCKPPPVEESLTEAEYSIPLHDLIPGMRLSRPLNAVDGRALVAADVALDEDLIMRIWQLSTLRSIRPAVVVMH